MKKIILATIILGFFSCTSQDGIYEEYLVPNGRSYPVPAKDVVAKPGNERIEIAWQNSADPKVVKARIFWNNYTDSVEIAVDASMNTVSRIIGPIEENSYSFMVRTYDAKGNVSIPVEVIGTVYGETYRGSLSNRILVSTDYDDYDLTLKLNWHNAFEGEEGVSVNYTDTHGVNHNIVVDPSETETLISDFDVEHPFFYSTTYKPDSLAIDVFHLGTVEKKIVVEPVTFIDKGTWREYNLPGDAQTYNASFHVSGLWDNDFEAGRGEYHSAFLPLPQVITWDLGVRAKLSRMKFWPRNNADDRWTRGHPRVFEIYGSLAPNPNGSLDDSWTLLGRFECVKPSPGPAITQEDIDFANAGIDFEFVKNELANPSTTVRYLRFRTVSNFDSNPNSTLVMIQEISFWGRIVR